MNKFLLIIDILLWWFSFEHSAPEALFLIVLLEIFVSIYLNFRLAKQNIQSKFLWSFIGVFVLYGVIIHYIQLYFLKKKISKETEKHPQPTPLN